MGLDLTLAPFDWEPFSYNALWLAYTRIRLPGGAGAFSVRLGEAKIPVHPLPPGVKFEWYEDEGLKVEREDPYGQPLTFVHAGDLVKVEPTNPRWAPAWAYLKALPPETPVLLWWH